MKNIKKEKVWCKHIFSGLHTEWRTAVSGYNVEVPKTWKLCPICECLRPTRANIAAAELRFLMDNDI